MPHPPCPRTSAGRAPASPSGHGGTPGTGLDFARTVWHTRRMEFVVVGIVCAAGLVIPVVLGMRDSRGRRGHR